MASGWARGLASAGLLALLAGGCAAPSWMPFMGKPAPPPPAPVIEAPPARPPAEPAPRRVEIDDTVADRVVAVVNNDAITLMELQENLVSAKPESRQVDLAEDKTARELLDRLIEGRLQLQEAEREKIVVEDVEVDEDLNERLKRLPGSPSRQDFEAAMKQQGVAIEVIRKKIRESIRMAKVVRRKVALRVTVNDQEIERYLEQNREKLETGLSYHARNILVTPDAGGASDAAWEAARIRAELLRAQIAGGADFAEVARQHSRDASAKDGGDLGTLKRGELAADVEAEILKLAPGQVSPPFRSTLGWHLFLLESKETLEGAALERARQQIRDILYREKYEARLAAWLAEIKRRAVIEVRL